MYKKYDLKTPYDFALSTIEYLEKDGVKGTNFTLLGIKKDGSKPTLFSTFGEKLVEKENSNFTLTFSISMYANDERNPLIDLIVNQRKLRLQTYDQIIDFVITNISPQITASNIIYTVTAQDVFSAEGVKMGVGLTFDSTDEDTYPNDVGPFNIKEMTKKILKYGKCTIWKVDEKLCSNRTPSFPVYEIYDTDSAEETKSSINISNSNIYNAVVTIASLFNARIKITYNENGIGGIISYENIAEDKFTGYRLFDDSNLTKMSYSVKSNTYYTVMNVSGGEDSNGYTVSLLPTMPNSLQQFLYENTIHDANLEINDVFAILGEPYLQVQEDDTVEFEYNNEIVVLDTEIGVLNFNFKDNDNNMYTSVYTLVLSRTKPESITNDLTFKTLEKKDTEGNIEEYYAIYERKSTTLNNQLDSWEEIEAGKLQEGIRVLLVDKNYSDSEKQEMLEYCSVIDEKIPSASSTLYNFTYLYKNGLMPQETFSTLNEKFGKELRNINLQLQFATQKYYSLNAESEKIIDLIEEKAAMMAANYSEVNGLITNPTETILDDSDYYTGEAARIHTANDNLDSALTTIATPINLTILKQLKGANYIDDLRVTLKTKEDKYKAYCKEAREKMNEILNAQRIEEGDTTLSLSDEEVVRILSKNWVQYTNYATYLATYNKYKVYLDETIYFTLENNVPTGKYAYEYVGGVLNPKQDVERVFKDKIDETISYTRKGYFTNYRLILDKIEQDSVFQSIKKSPEGLYSIKKFYENLKEKQNVFWQKMYELYGNYLISINYTDNTQLDSSGLYFAATQKFVSYIEPTPTYSASIVRYEELSDALNAPIHIGNYVYLYNDLLFKEKSESINFVITVVGKYKKIISNNIEWETNKKGVYVKPSKTQVYFDPHKGVYLTRIYCKIINTEGAYIYNKIDTYGIHTVNNSMVLKINYNYESVPVKLHIMEISNTMREKTINLTLSDTARTDAILGKLMYMVRGK